jgi:hypothetical protein
MENTEQQSEQKRFFDNVLSHRLANFFLTGFFRI